MARLEPAADLVLVVDAPRTTVIDEIAMPDNVKQQEMVFGTVVAIGSFVTVGTKVGDQIAYGPYAGKNVVIGGSEFRILKEGQIEAYLRD